MASSILTAVLKHAGLWAAALAAAIVGLSAYQIGLYGAFSSEQYGAEVASLVLWLLAVPLIVRAGVPTQALSRWLAALFVLFVLRELDFHNWWFEPGLLHIQIFSSPVPLWQKAVSLTAIAGVLSVVMWVLVRGARPFLRGLWLREPPVLWAALGMGCAAISTQLDGIGRRLDPFGIEVSQSVQRAAVVVEESLELAFPILTITAISSAWSRRETRSAPNG